MSDAGLRKEGQRGPLAGAFRVAESDEVKLKIWRGEQREREKERRHERLD
jgi:hypothetical protein